MPPPRKMPNWVELARHTLTTKDTENLAKEVSKLTARSWDESTSVGAGPSQQQTTSQMTATDLGTESLWSMPKIVAPDGSKTDRSWRSQACRASLLAAERQTWRSDLTAIPAIAIPKQQPNVRARILTSERKSMTATWPGLTQQVMDNADGAMTPRASQRATGGAFPRPEVQLQRQRFFDASNTFKKPDTPLRSRRKAQNRAAKALRNFGLTPAAMAVPVRGSENEDVFGGLKTFANCPTMQSDFDTVVFGRDMDFSGDSKFDEEFTVMFAGCRGMPSWEDPPRRGVRLYENAPMMQSTVDQVVFGRDMDFSGESKFDEEFTQMFDGSAGLPSWHYER